MDWLRATECCCVQFSYCRIESTKCYAVLVDKDAVAGAISAGSESAILYEHGGNQGQLRADDSMRYCPSWGTPNKTGRPSKGKRKLSALEKSQGKKKKPKPLTRFCQICRGFSHRTIDCWHQEKWMTERAAIEEAIFISADPVPIWPGFQTQGSKEDVDEEGSEEDVDEDEEFDEINEETIVSAGGGEGESQEQEEGTAD